MNQKHSPNTEKVKYMLSDFNDHYEMREQFIDNSSKYVKMTIWFGGLRNTLITNVGYDGEILMGNLKCIAESGVTEEEVANILPSNVELSQFSSRDKNTTFRVIIHSTRNADTMDPKKYIETVKEVKSAIMKQGYIADR